MTKMCKRRDNYVEMFPETSNDCNEKEENICKIYVNNNSQRQQMKNSS